MVNADRLVDTFKFLVGIDSPSKKEGLISNEIKIILEGLGAETFVDDAGKKIGSDTGNLIARLKGNKAVPPLLLNAHMDTVSPGEGVKATFKDGVFTSDGSTILGADDKSAIAILIETIRVLNENNLSYGPLELVFTICEEVGLLGAKHLDFSLITETLTEEEAQNEAQRCLQCDVICNICATVCPNRANVSYLIEPMDIIIQRATQTGNIIQVRGIGRFYLSQSFQIINIGDFCNECGNCSTFCPTDGEPYRVKPKFYITKQGFDEAGQGYMLLNGTLHFKNDGKFEILSLHDDSLIYETSDITAILNPRTFNVKDIRFKNNDNCSIEMDHAVKMGILHQALKDFYLFR